MKREKEKLLFLGIFDALALGSVVGFLINVIPNMDWSNSRSGLAMTAFACFITGVLSMFGTLNVQAFYPTLDSHMENGKEVLEATPKNKKYFKLMSALLGFGSASIVLGLFGWVLTYVLYGF